MTKRAVFTLIRETHAWAGAAISLVLFVLALSGTLLVFKTEYLKLVLPEARQEADLSADALANITRQADERFGEEMTAIVFAEPDFGLHRVYLQDGGGAYLNGDGDVVAVFEKNGRIEEWLFDLHHHLLAGPVGESVASIVGLLTILLVIGGVVAFWPMRRGLRRGLQAESLARAEARSLHRNLGLLAATPTVIAALSGAMLGFPAATKALLTAGADAPRPTILSSEMRDGSAPALIEQADPHLGSVRIAVPERDGRAAFIRLKQRTEWHPNGRTVLRADEVGLLMVDAEALPLGERIANAAYPVHAGKLKSTAARLALFAGGLVLTLTTFIGLVSFLQRSSLRRIERSVPAPPRTGRT